MRVLHVLHQRFAAEEQLMADRAAGCVRAADEGGVLLQHAQMQLQFLVGGAEDRWIMIRVRLLMMYFLKHVGRRVGRLKDTWERFRLTRFG